MAARETVDIPYRPRSPMVVFFCLLVVSCGFCPVVTVSCARIYNLSLCSLTSLELCQDRLRGTSFCGHRFIASQVSASVFLRLGQVDTQTGKGRTNDKRSKSPEARHATRGKIPCLWEQDVENRRVIICILPCVVNYKSGNRFIHGNNCLHRHADGEEKPSKSSKCDSTQRAVAILTEEKKAQGCGSQNSDPKKVYSAENEVERFGGTRIQILRTHLVRSSNPGKKRAISRRYPKGEPHERNPCAPKFEERTPEETSRKGDSARKAAWDLARKCTSSRPRTKLRFVLL